MAPKQRAPLSNLPNALNSPIRSTASKRSRADGKTLLDDAPAPAAKRQHMSYDYAQQRERENIPALPQTPQKRRPSTTLDANVGHGGRSAALDRERIVRQQALLAKEKAEMQREKNLQRVSNDTQKENLDKWRRHYEKKFPDYVFFFENIPEDVRRKYSRQIKELGAQEDRFFSKGVTHVVTTRQVPNEAETPLEGTHPVMQQGVSHGTINPTLLDNRGDARDDSGGTARGKSVFDVALSKKAGLAGSPDKQRSSKVDVLQKAVDLGIKVWQLEKLQRVLMMMFLDDDGEDESYERENHDAGNRAVTRAPKKQTDTLSRLIKKEEQSKNSAFDFHALLRTEQIPLQEPYIFVRCMNERTKPLLVRQYTKVSKPSEGEWPQFRAVTQGKCPFIIEENKSRRSEKNQKKERERDQRPQQRVTRAQAADVRDGQDHEAVAGAEGQSHYFNQAQNLQPYETAKAAPLATLAQAPLTRMRSAQRHGHLTIREEDEENQDLDRTKNECDPATCADEDATTDAPVLTPTEATFPKFHDDKGQHSRQTSFDMMAPPAPLPRPNPAIGQPGGEPTASGLQRSGATAAIRSTMGISSAAAQPGIKTGVTRDMHSLQRRVLDRYSTGGSGSTLGMSAPAAPPAAQTAHNGRNAVPESRRIIDPVGRVRTENPRAAKVKAQEKIHIQHRQPIEHERDGLLTKAAKQHERERGVPQVKREPKPGYCENCKDKFDDFEEHVHSRKHRKFATTRDNWAGLDALLAQLDRPKRKCQAEFDHDQYSNPNDRQASDFGHERANKRSRLH